jgi:hypothetical protein
MVHVVTTSPQLTVTEIVPRDVERLHPDNLTGGVGNTALTQFLAQNLNTRSAKRQGVVALVLSAVYLPSQLDVMHALAGNQQLDYAVHLSKNDSAMHVVFHTVRDEQQENPSEDDIHSALEAALGPLQLMPAARLQAAHNAERRLQQQLRLWDSATWSAALQQRLESRRSGSPWLAIRSLMGPPALQAAQKLVEKKRLQWLEVPEGRMKALSRNSSSTSAGDRRRPGRRGSSTSEQGGGGAEGVVIVISTYELTAEQVAELSAGAFTDRGFLEPGSASISNSNVAQEDGGDDDSPRSWPMNFWR